MISSDPQDTFEVKLSLSGKAFKLRFITARESVRVAKLVTQASDEKDGEKALDLLDEAILIGLPANSEKPSLSLSLVELWELADLTHIAPVEQELQKKRLSASVPATSSVPSAEAAPPANA